MIRPILAPATTRAGTLCPDSSPAAKRQSAIASLPGYAVALVLCLLCLTWTFKLWRADLHVPFVYGQDGLLTAAMVKGVIDNPWYWHNDYLGAPFGSDLYDFPQADGLHFLAFKGLALVYPDWAAAVNLYYLLGFPLTALTALFVLRRFRISFAPAAVASLLFTFLPYRLIRSEGHLFLSAYYLVPLMALVVLWLYLEPERFFRTRVTGRRTFPGW